MTEQNTIRVRKKQISVDGAEFTIGGMTFKQRGEIIGEGKKVSVVKLIATSLANAEPDAGWTPEKVTRDIDPLAYDGLLDEISKFNDIKWANPNAGEEQAAAPVTSSSAAV